MPYKLVVIGKKSLFYFVYLKNSINIAVRLRTIIAALHCNIIVRKEDLIRNLDYVANVLECVHQDETR